MDTEAMRCQNAAQARQLMVAFLTQGFVLAMAQAAIGEAERRKAPPRPRLLTVVEPEYG